MLQKPVTSAKRGFGRERSQATKAIASSILPYFPKAPTAVKIEGGQRSSRPDFSSGAERSGMRKREARTEAEAPVKFVITQWNDEFDYDGLTNDFCILGEFRELAEAQACLHESVNRLAAERLSEHPGWQRRIMDGKEHAWDRVNKNNKVIEYGSFGIGDGTGYNSIYTYLELIELPADVGVDEKLFDVEYCRYEVSRYFKAELEKL
jgi:hypothetical protein